MANVLVIDDDEDVTRLLQEQLTEEGHAVTVAHQGDEGMAKALQATPDLIMLDVFLPDATGYQICNQIRKNPSTQAVPIIMMTGAAKYPNQEMYGRERGANEYICKPFNVIEVGELVHKYIGAKKNAAASVQQEPVQAPDAGARPLDSDDDLTALNSFLERSLTKMKATEDAYEETEPAAAASVSPADAPLPPAEALRFPFTAPAENGQSATAPEEFVSTILASKDRFIDFGLEVFALATRLSSTHAEQYLADQLLRSSLSVGAQLTESRSATSPAEFLERLQAALKDLREAGYWLMIAHKIGLLELLNKTDLEKTCQSLTTLLTDFLNAEKKRASL